MEQVTALNLPTDAIDFLVNEWLVLANDSCGCVQHEFALGIDVELVNSRKAKGDEARIGTGRDIEVILQLFLIAVIDQVDSLIKLLVLNPGKSGHVGMP